MAPRALALSAVVVLVGCTAFEPREIRDCETQLLAKLKAPASYKRVSVNRTFMEGYKPQEILVSIDYDAVNSFNAPLRDTEICKYPATPGGEVDWEKRSADLEFEAEAALAEADAATKAADEALRQADAPHGESSVPAPKSYPYVAPDGVDIRNAEDEANWKKYGTTTPDGGE